MKFEKVSLEQYYQDSLEVLKDHNADIDNLDIEKDWEDLVIPTRATKGSAGYDFSMPFDITLEPNESYKSPTGIKCELDLDKILMIVPRSSLGFKYGVRIANTCGIVDSDYYNNENNEGHIFIKIVNGDKPLCLAKGERFAQGLIFSYFTTEDDNTDTERVGGIGSTNKG